jgi:hypothetical protein
MGRSLRLLAGLALGVALATAAGGAAGAIPPPPTTIEDQDERRTPNPLVEEAWRSREAVERFRSGERHFVPDPDIIGHPINPPQARPVPAHGPRPFLGQISGWSPTCSWAWSGAWSAGSPSWSPGPPPPVDACASSLPPPDPPVHTVID